VDIGIELIGDAGLMKSQRLEPLLAEANELVATMVSSIQSAARNLHLVDSKKIGRKRPSLKSKI